MPSPEGLTPILLLERGRSVMDSRASVSGRHVPGSRPPPLFFSSPKRTPFFPLFCLFPFPFGSSLPWRVGLMDLHRNFRADPPPLSSDSFASSTKSFVTLSLLRRFCRCRDISLAPSSFPEQSFFFILTPLWCRRPLSVSLSLLNGPFRSFLHVISVKYASSRYRGSEFSPAVCPPSAVSVPFPP